jgi:hypothetical protein
MNGLSRHFKKTCEILSKGMKPGAYNKLKEAYPEYFKTINDKLDNNFTIEGIDEYRETYIRGFKKVGMWREP